MAVEIIEVQSDVFQVLVTIAPEDLAREYAREAELSAIAAAESETAAGLSEQEAFDSEQAAALSAANAGQSAIDALASEQAAALSAIDALASENVATTKAGEAAVSADEAEAAALLATAERRSDFVDPISYIGKAPGGTLENQPLWTISKIVVDVDGTTVKTVAVDVSWTNRLTATYI